MSAAETDRGDERRYDAIVIGAGVAGLCAAQRLHAAGLSTLTLEARDKIGGRVETLGRGETALDLGASWVMGPQGNPIGPLLTEQGARLRLSDWESVIYYYEGEEIDYSDWAEDFYDHLERRKRMKRRGDESLAAALASFITDNRIEGYDALLLRHVIGAEIESEYASDLARLSLLSYEEGDEFEGGDAFVIGGYALCAEALARGLDIRLSAPVARIEQHETGVRIATASAAYRADYAIVTIPLRPLASGAVAFDPPLSQEKTAAVSELGIGNLHKTFFEFDSQFWDDEQVISIVRDGAPMWREFYNLAGLTGRPLLLAFHAGAAATSLIGAAPETLTHDALAVLRAVYPDAPAPLRTIASCWEQDPYIGGSYSFVTVGGSLDACDILAAPQGRIHFAGEHTSSSYNGTVHGAFLSGERAAEEVLRRLRDGA